MSAAPPHGPAAQPEASSPTHDVARQGLVGPAATMALGTALSRLTGLGRVGAVAFALGIAESRLADSYNIANTVPNVLYELVLGGVLSSVFIPILVQELRTSRSEVAWEAVSAMISAAALVLAAVSLLTLALAPAIVAVFSGRVPEPEATEQRELATFLLRWFAPQIALYGITALAEGLLNAHGRFGLPMFVPILNNLVVMGAFVAFGIMVAGTPDPAGVAASPAQKLVLGAGTTAGVAAMAIALWPAVRRLPGRIRPRLSLRHPAVRKVARLSVWTVGYVASNAVGVGVAFYLANAQQGGPSAYAIAFAFFQVPIGIVAVSIVTALTPRMSAHHVDADRAAFAAALGRGLRVTALLLIPTTALYIVLAQPLIETLLAHGVVSTDSSSLVAQVLAYFAIGLLPFSVYLLLMRAFYARQDARTPALVNLLENGVTIVLSLVLFPPMGVQGLALAHTLGYVAGCAVAAAVLSRGLGGPVGAGLGRPMAKTVAAGALAAGAALLALAILERAGNPADAAPVQVAVGGIAGGLAFLLAARALGVPDLAPPWTLRTLRLGRARVD